MEEGLFYFVVTTTLEVDVGFEVTVVDESTHSSHLNAFDFEEGGEVEDVWKVKTMSETVSMPESEEFACETKSYDMRVKVIIDIGCFTFRSEVYKSKKVTRPNKQNNIRKFVYHTAYPKTILLLN